MIFRMLSLEDKHAEIRRLYYETTRATIQRDLARALDLLKSMPSEEERERAAVYMDGLSEMRREWDLAKRKEKGRGKPSRRNVAGRASPDRRKS